MEKFIKRQIAGGCQIADLTAFGGALVPELPWRPWEVNCVISFPKVPMVLEQVIDFERSVSVLYLVVTVTYPDGEVRFDKMRPHSILKSVVDTDGIRWSTRGTAVDFMRSFLRMDDAVNALAGRDIVITEKTMVKTRDFRNPDLSRSTSIYGFDLVGYKYPLGA